MADAGNGQEPESSSSAPFSWVQEKFEHFAPSDSKLAFFYEKKRRYLKWFSRYLQFSLKCLEDFFRIFPTSFSDITIIGGFGENC